MKTLIVPKHLSHVLKGGMIFCVICQHVCCKGMKCYCVSCREAA